MAAPLVEVKYDLFEHRVCLEDLYIPEACKHRKAFKTKISITSKEKKSPYSTAPHTLPHLQTVALKFFICPQGGEFETQLQRQLCVLLFDPCTAAQYVLCSLPQALQNWEGSQSHCLASRGKQRSKTAK